MVETFLTVKIKPIKPLLSFKQIHNLFSVRFQFCSSPHRPFSARRRLKMVSKNEIRGLVDENGNLKNENLDLRTQIENLNRQQMNLNEQFIVLKSER